MGIHKEMFIKKEKKAVIKLKECKYPLTDSTMCFKGLQGDITKFVNTRGPSKMRRTSMCSSHWKPRGWSSIRAKADE